MFKKRMGNMRFPEEIKRIRQRCFLTQSDFAIEVQLDFKVEK